jgi:hypothetical protein
VQRNRALGHRGQAVIGRLVTKAGRAAGRRGSATPCCFRSGRRSARGDRSLWPWCVGTGPDPALGGRRIIAIGSDGMMANLAEAHCAGLNGGGIGYKLCRTLLDHFVGDV